VQPDGTIAYVLDEPGGSSLYAASPAHPAPAAIGPWGAATVTRLVQPGPPLVLREGRLAGRLNGGRILLEGLDGAPLASLRTRGEHGFDFDGQHLAVVETPCSEAFLQTWSLGEAAPAPPAGRCPRDRVDHVSFAHDAVRLRASCPSLPPLGCQVTQFFVEPFGTEVEEAGPRFQPRPVTLLPGTSRAISLPLPGRWVRSHRHQRVEIAALVGGQTRRTHARITLP
jgi:hypothetical protein